MKKVIALTVFLFFLGCTVYSLYPNKKKSIASNYDKLVVYKSKRQLLAYSKGQLIKTYKISLGQNPVGKKEIEGDKKTPEGLYTIDDKNPNSDFHKIGRAHV